MREYASIGLCFAEKIGVTYQTSQRAMALTPTAVVLAAIVISNDFEMGNKKGRIITDPAFRLVNINLTSYFLRSPPPSGLSGG